MRKLYDIFKRIVSAETIGVNTVSISMYIQELKSKKHISILSQTLSPFCQIKVLLCYLAIWVFYARTLNFLPVQNEFSCTKKDNF